MQTSRAEDARREEPSTEIAVHRSSPGRVVFAEADNPDGWIATDLTVSLDR